MVRLEDIHFAGTLVWPPVGRAGALRSCKPDPEPTEVDDEGVLACLAGVPLYKRIFVLMMEDMVLFQQKLVRRSRSC